MLPKIYIYRHRYVNPNFSYLQDYRVFFFYFIKTKTNSDKKLHGGALVFLILKTME